MNKKSMVNRYRSKLILEELEARQLFSDGAAAVTPPPETNDTTATVINVDANIEPVVESQNTVDAPAIANVNSVSDHTNPDENSSPVTAVTSGVTINESNEISIAESDADLSKSASDPAMQDNDYSKVNEPIQLAITENNPNKKTELLTETDSPIVLEIFSEENEIKPLANLSATDTINGNGALDNQSILNHSTLSNEITSPELEIRPLVNQSLTAARNELIFVDIRVDDYQQLVDDIVSQSGTGRNFNVIMLDGSKDGITQITETLSHYQNLDAVHLISHGSDGNIDLGTNQLNFQTLIQNQAQIKSWGNAFAANGDFLIYGCNVAETQYGQSLVNYLSGLTGTDIAASNDATGYASLGADWKLEYQSGIVETQNAISVKTQNLWTEVLAVTSNSTVTSTANDNITSLTWSHTVNAGSNRALFVEIAIDNLGANVNGVTYGGVAMTQVGRTGGNHAVEIWALVNPTIGTANVVVSFSGNTTASAGASTFNGVNQSTPYGTFAGNSGTTSLLSGLTGSVTVASAPGDVVIDAQFWTDTLANPVGAGQTSQWSSSSLLASALGSSSSEAGAASVTMSGTASILSALGAEWSIGAVSVKAATNTAPVITSNGGGANTSINVSENSTTVTSVTATDVNGDVLTYSISGGADAGKFSIDSNTGALRFIAAPNYETPTDIGANNIYDVTVQVSDGSLTDTQDISVTIANLDEAAPTLTSGAAAAVDENSGAGQVVYTATATDSADIASGSTSYSLGGADAALFSIDAGTGAVTLLGNPNFEAKASYSFTVTATDAAGHASAPLAVTLAVNNLDEAPTGKVNIFGITSLGHTLTVSDTLDDPDGLGDITYTWQTDGVTVGIGSSYTLASSDIGKEITVIASYIDGHGTFEHVASASALVVKDVNPPTLPSNGTDKPASTDKDTTHVFSPLQPDDKSANIFDDIDLFSSNANGHARKEPAVITDLKSHIEKLLINSNNADFVANQYTEPETGYTGKKQAHSSHVTQAISVLNKRIKITNGADEAASLEGIDQIRQQFDHVDLTNNSKKVDVQIMLGTTVAFTAGFVSWVLRGGALLSSFMSTIPLINRFDPVPILRSSKKAILVASKKIPESNENNKTLELNEFESTTRK